MKNKCEAVKSSHYIPYSEKKMSQYSKKISYFTRVTQVREILEHNWKYGGPEVDVVEVAGTVTKLTLNNEG